MSFEPITLELQYEERDLLRLIPFIKRQVAGIQWYILPFAAFFCVVFGALMTIYRVGTMETYPTIVMGEDHVKHLVTVRESLFHAVWATMSLMFVGLVLTGFSIRRTPSLVRKMIAEQPELLQPFTLTISETGMEQTTKGVERKEEWGSVKNVYEKLGGLIVVLQSERFHFIPSWKISEENYLLAKKVLKEKVGITEV